MVANELMLGDWVYVPHNGSATHYARVIGIYSRDVVSTELDKMSGLIKADALEPIPLTPEILEKNGFEARGYEELVLEADQYCFALQKGVDGINAWWWEMFSSPIIPINYVHELQHALRLCGIEKEIEL